MAKGGRGGRRGSWKSQLKKMAAQDIMPKAFTGNREAQAQFFKEIDKLYPMPQVSTRYIIPRETDVYVDFGNKVKVGRYPSGAQASEAEKRGVLKWLLHP